MRLRWMTMGLVAIGVACTSGTGEAGPASSMQVTSPAFAANGPIPARFTCEGEDVSPALNWTGVPAGARSLVLIVDDPDAPDPAAPTRTWVHWVLYNLPPDAGGLPEAVRSATDLPPGTAEGLNDWNRVGWGGPCPPVGRHRYHFRLFALDRLLPDLRTPSRAQLDQAMQGHVIAQAVLVGTYQKQKP